MSENRRVAAWETADPIDAPRHPLYGKLTPFVLEVRRRVEAGAYDTAQNGSRPKTVRDHGDCGICGGPLPPNRSRYCGDACARIAHNGPRAEPRTLKCERCRSEFVTISRNARYCDDFCRERASRAREKLRRIQRGRGASDGA